MPAIPVPVIAIEDLMDRYEVLLLDAYGVLVTRDGPLPGAAALVDALNRRGRPWYLLTNGAARLPENAARRYQGFGLAIPAERIITSASLLVPHFRAEGLIGKRCAVLGPADSLRYVELAGGRPVPAGEDFEVLVVCDQSGFPFLDTLDAVISRLFARIDAGLPVPLILPNPDLVYPTGRGFGITSGCIALVIEAALRLRYPNRPDLAFVRLGKPHAAIFEEAARRAGGGDMVMIGDQLETDIRGAAAFGIDSALVAGGVADVGQAAEGGVRPTWLLASLNPG